MVHKPSPCTAMPADTAVQWTSKKNLVAVCECLHASLCVYAWRGLFGWQGLMDC